VQQPTTVGAEANIMAELPFYDRFPPSQKSTPVTVERPTTVRIDTNTMAELPFYDRSSPFVQPKIRNKKPGIENNVTQQGLFGMKIANKLREDSEYALRMQDSSPIPSTSAVERAYENRVKFNPIQRDSRMANEPVGEVTFSVPEFGRVKRKNEPSTACRRDQEDEWNDAKLASFIRAGKSIDPKKNPPLTQCTIM